MHPIDEFYKRLAKGRCRPCEYARHIVADGEFIFLGCYHEPYTGKWVAEIKDCPKESKEADQLISLKEVINNGIKN